MIIKNLLSKIGLNDKEAQIYQALLELGSAPASLIAKKASLPRQTTYSILGEMVERGYIETTESRGVTHFIGDPKSLLILLEKQKAEIDKQKDLIQTELPRLIALRQQKALPSIQLFEGDEGMKKLFEHILDYYRHDGVKEFRGFGINKIDETSIQDFIRSFLERRHKYGVKTKLIASKEEDDFGINGAAGSLGRDVRKIDIGSETAAMYLVGDQVYLFSYEDKVGIMIQNTAIMKLLKDYFDHTWDGAK